MKRKRRNYLSASGGTKVDQASVHRVAPTSSRTLKLTFYCQKYVAFWLRYMGDLGVKLRTRALTGIKCRSRVIGSKTRVQDVCYRLI